MIDKIHCGKPFGLLPGITIQEQKLASFEVLQALKMIDNDAIIAGGAPRNWDQGKLANDIDCYLRWNLPEAGRIIKTINKLLGTNNITLYTSHEVSHYAMGGQDLSIRKLVNFWYKGVLFQIILVHEDKPLTNFRYEIVHHMDIGINMISCDWHFEWDIPSYIKSQEYITDVENKTLTILQSVVDKEQLHHCLTVHLPKMISYYPDYEIIFAPQQERKVPW